MQLFYELIQVAVGTRNRLSRIPSADEWQAAFAASQKQSLVGICFQGINNLYPDNPEMVENLPGALKMKWMAFAIDIQRRNSLTAADSSPSQDDRDCGDSSGECHPIFLR